MNKKYYGQHGLDAILEKYCPLPLGRAINCGAYDGLRNDNTYIFERKGWEVINIEPNPYIFLALQKNRRGPNFNVACGKEPGKQKFYIYELDNGGAQSSVSSLEPDQRLINQHKHCIQRKIEVEVEVRTLTDILDELDIEDVDLVSIDTEGTELQILQSFDLSRWQPDVLVIENNFDETELPHYLSRQGYIRDKRYYVNDIYIRVDND